MLFAYYFCYHTALGSDVQQGGFLGADSYTRVLWVQQLAEGGGWFDENLKQFNVPDGMEVHWTKPVDSLLLAMAYPLHWFGDLSLAQAVARAALVLSPMLAGVTLIALGMVLQRIGVASAFLLLPIVFVLQPSLMFQFAWGRPDHHALQLTSFAVLISTFALCHKGNALWLGVLAGLMATLSVWISPEGLIVAAMAIGLSGLGCLLTDDSTWRRFSKTLALTLFPAALSALLIERGFLDFWEGAGERYSLYQALFLMLGGGGILLVERFGQWRKYSWRQVAIVSGYACLAGAIIWGTGVIRLSHKSYLDPRIQSVIFDNNSEFLPLITDPQGFGKIAAYLMGGLAVLLVTAYGYRHPKVEFHDRIKLAFAALVVLFFGVLTLFVSIRWSGYVQILGLFAFGFILHQLLRSRLNFLIRALGVVAIILMPLLALASASKPAQSKPAADGQQAQTKQRCDWTSAGEVIAQATNGRDREASRLNVLAPLFDGPKLAWFGSVGIVAGPYAHAQPILDTDLSFRASDFAKMQEVVSDRRIDLVMVCRWNDNALRDLGETSAQHRLQVQNDLPIWLELGAGSTDDAHGLLAYRVVVDQD